MNNEWLLLQCTPMGGCAYQSCTLPAMTRMDMRQLLSAGRLCNLYALTLIGLCWCSGRHLSDFCLCPGRNHHDIHYLHAVLAK